MDFITGLPPSSWRGSTYDAILVIVEMYTKYVLYLPCTKEIDAPELAELLYDRMIPLWGMPENLVSDRGSLFTSEFWSTFCWLLAVKRRLSTAYHPQTDGQTERQNQTLEYFLRSYVNWQQDDWARWLPIAQFTYNGSIHATTGLAPHEALMGWRPDLRGSVLEYPQEHHTDAASRVAEITEMRAFMRDKIVRAKEAMKRHYDEKRTPMSFKIGDWVYLRRKNFATGRPSAKLDHKMIGPFEILDRIGTQAYRLRMTPRFRLLHPTHHVSVLERHKGKVPSAESAPAPVNVDGNVEYEIDKILTHRGAKTRTYLVKWRGYEDAEATWEPRESLENTEALDVYEKRNSQDARKTSPRAKKGSQPTKEINSERAKRKRH
jgi:hypothetical protein